MADAVDVVTEVVVAARVAVTTTDWRSAIRAACQPLVDLGALEPRYADRSVSTVEEQGPYIVLAPGVALAHARPEDGAVRLALGAVILARPVAFGHPTNDPVDVVFAFGSPDRDAHVGLLAALSRRLLDGLADELRAAPSDAAATALLGTVREQGTSVSARRGRSSQGRGRSKTRRGGASCEDRGRREERHPAVEMPKLFPLGPP